MNTHCHLMHNFGLLIYATSPFSQFMAPQVVLQEMVKYVYYNTNTIHDKIDVQILWITNTTHQVVLMMPMHSDNQYRRLIFFSWNSSLNHMCNWSRCCKLWIVRIQCCIGSMCIWSQIYMIVLFLFLGYIIDIDWHDENVLYYSELSLASTVCMYIAWV